MCISANQAPVIHGNTDFQVTVNEVTHFDYSVSDPDNDSITLEILELDIHWSFSINQVDNHVEGYFTPTDIENSVLR